MLAHTKLPRSAIWIQRLTYPFLRHFFYFFFAYLPYGPVRRVNKPDLEGPFLWASSHSNFMCDAIPPGYEGPCPTKFLAKSTLFRFPIKGFIEFCGALPVTRAEDFRKGTKRVPTSQNRSTFRVAIAALKEGWPITIFPEGVSIVSPGLVLPLKPGVAKLAFAAEEAHGFSLGLQIIPVGLEYGSRTRVGSGLTIRYGSPILISEFRELYAEAKDKAVQAVMEALTNELMLHFPHFRDEKTAALGKKLVALGLCRSKHQAAQLFLRRNDDGAFWAGLEKLVRALEEAASDSGIPVPAWGHRRAWKELGPVSQRKRLIFLFMGAPLAVIDLLNNSLPELCLQSVIDAIAVDETEKMSLRFLLAPLVLGVVYALQFWLLRQVMFLEWLGRGGFGFYLAYSLSSFLLWFLGVHWRRQFKRMVSLFFFRRAGASGRQEAMAYYRALRQYLGQF